jgi:predicted metallopeptidase
VEVGVGTAVVDEEVSEVVADLGIEDVEDREVLVVEEVGVVAEAPGEVARLWLLNPIVIWEFSSLVERKTLW